MGIFTHLYRLSRRAKPFVEWAEHLDYLGHLAWPKFVLMGIAGVLAAFVAWVWDQPWPMKLLVGLVVWALIVLGTAATLEIIDRVRNRLPRSRGETIVPVPPHKELAAPAAVQKCEPPRRPLTMRQIFDSDFPGMGKIFMSSKFVSADGNKKDFAFTEHLIAQTNSYFLSLYFDRMDNILDITRLVASKIPDIIIQLGQMSFEIITPGDTRSTGNDTMAFSKNIYLYYEQDLILAMQSLIESIFFSYGYSVIIRSTAYLALHWNEFDRHPVGAAAGAGAQLPKVDGPTSVSIKNDIGTRPFWYDGPVSFDGINVVPVASDAQSIRQPINPPASSHPSPAPPASPEETPR